MYTIILYPYTWAPNNIIMARRRTREKVALYKISVHKPFGGQLKRHGERVIFYSFETGYLRVFIPE